MEVRSRVRWISAPLRYWDRACLTVALCFLAYLFWQNAMLASRSVEGTRYFLLDDDMMISMRYARNLAEGHGLVWNPGERIEGYTNFLWTMVMAGVHLLPVGEAKICLAVKLVSLLLLGGSFYLSLRLVRLFAPRSFLAPPVLFTCMTCCVDILHWSVWGFETALMTFLLLLFLDCVLERRLLPLGFLALSLIPLVRGDGLHIFIACAVIALVLAKNPVRTAIYLGAALLPMIGHIAFRRSYYGEWLPNTYYLKVYKLDGTYARGAMYARNFLLRYSVLLILAAGSSLAITRGDRRGIVLFVAVLGTLAYAVTTGGDMFGNFRFFAHVMPLVYVFAAAGIATLARGRLGSIVWAGLMVMITFPVIRPMSQLVAFDTNGDPYEQIQVAMILRKNARPDSSVAVIPAGIVPYFTRMRSIDILGKNDKHIARLAPFPGSMVGHGKLDPQYTIAKQPDLIVSCRSHAWVSGLPTDARTTDIVLSFLASSPFQQEYRPYVISEEFTVGRTAIYTRAGSSENANRVWRTVKVTP